MTDHGAPVPGVESGQEHARTQPVLALVFDLCVYLDAARELAVELARRLEDQARF